jgi:hypothetical protein
MSQRAPPFRTGPPFIEAFLAQTGSPRTEPPQGRGPLRVRVCQFFGVTDLDC